VALDVARRHGEQYDALLRPVWERLAKFPNFTVAVHCQTGQIRSAVVHGIMLSL